MNEQSDQKEDDRFRYSSLEFLNERLHETDAGGGGESLLESGIPRIAMIRPVSQTPGQKQQRTSKSKTTSKKKQDDPYRSYVKVCCSGVFLMIMAYLVYFINPVQVAKDITLNMRDGSYLFNMWKSPPIKLYIKIFIFNITNAEKFIKGIDKSIKVVEIGPYTYSETVQNEKVTWNPNQTLSFTPSRNVVFEPDMSVGDPETDMIYIPNIPLLGLASLLHNSSMAMNLAVSTLVSYLDSQPILELSVHSFLWGYEDPMVRLAKNILPSWIDFPQFGLLDRMMDEGVNRITMSLHKSNETSEFSIQRFNGSPGLKQWGYNPETDTSDGKCNRVEGTIEGYLFPRNVQKDATFTVYRKAFCRPLPLIFDKEDVSNLGYPIFLFKFPENILDPKNPDNSCYCQPQKGPCLPPGLSDLSPCYYNFPVAISLPHFYNSNTSLMANIEGLTPSAEKHRTVFAIQPEVGVPVFVKTRIQTNLVMRKTKFIPRVKPFNNLVIPILWMEVEMLGLPASVNLLIVLLLQIGPVLQTGAVILFSVVGLILVFIANLRYLWTTDLFNSRRTAKMISYKQKQKQNDSIIWRSSRYSQLVPIGPSLTHDGKTR